MEAVMDMVGGESEVAMTAMEEMARVREGGAVLPLARLVKEGEMAAVAMAAARKVATVVAAVVLAMAMGVIVVVAAVMVSIVE